MKNTVVFAGGGTGGHIYPGLAVADELRNLATQQSSEIRIIWFGNSKGMDRDIVEKSGSVDSFAGIPSGKLRRYLSFQNLLDVFKIFAGFVVSFCRLLVLRPAVLFSKGGFVSVPPCVAAKILGIPVLTHECDFTPGLATRINSRFASKILISYEETRRFFSEAKQDRLLVTGNPVRPAFYAADGEKGRAFLFREKSPAFGKPILLVLGGSLGAHQLNCLVTQNLDWLCERYIVVHQTGKADAQLCETKHENYYPYAFIYKEMCDVIASSDIILSRSGANTIWEGAVLGKPMVLVPLCGSGTRGDQVDNARFFVDKGAAFMLAGDDADSSHLKDCLCRLEDTAVRTRMADASHALGNERKSAAEIARIVYEQISKTGV